MSLTTEQREDIIDVLVAAKHALTHEILMTEGTLKQITRKRACEIRQSKAISALLAQLDKEKKV